MDPKNVTKTYNTDEVNVLWQSGKCIHSGNCVKNLKSVFNPKQSPWIQFENSTTQEILDTVAKCPSGALSIQ